MQKQKLTSEKLSGVTTAIVTPFDLKGEVDYRSIQHLANKAVNAKIAGVVVLGTTGESPTVEQDEYEKITETVLKTVNDKISVILGIGTNSTKKTLKNLKFAESVGVDGVLVVAPYYNKPTQAGLRNHYLQIADSSKLPIILYHIPGRCGIGISYELALELGKHENIIAIKEAGGDIWRSGEIARQNIHNYAVLSGDDNITLPLMSVGLTGVISVISNVAPVMFKEMIDACLRNDFATALALHQKLSPLLIALSLETNPAPIKAALMLNGDIPTDTLRSPMAQVSAENRAKIAKALSDLGSVQ